MTTTILAAIALSGSLVASAKPEFKPQTDYSLAMRQAAAEGKPMAVLIGNGNPFAKLMEDAKLPEATAKLLREKFVCVAVDVTTPAGAKLASQFDLTDGLVISSAGGTHQALRHPGVVSAADLAKHTANYATVTGTPATTVTVGAPVLTSTSGYTPSTSGTVIYSNGGYVYPSYSYSTIGGCPNGNCAVPAVYGYPTVNGCPNGRCPTPR